MMLSEGFKIHYSFTSSTGMVTYLLPPPPPPPPLVFILKIATHTHTHFLCSVCPRLHQVYLHMLHFCFRSYNLLCEDNPDDFINVEMPIDSTTSDSDAPPLEIEEVKKKGHFLDSLRRNHGPGGVTKTVITGGRSRCGVFIADRDMVGGARKLAIHEVTNDWPVLQPIEVEEDKERMDSDYKRTEPRKPWGADTHTPNMVISSIINAHKIFVTLMWIYTTFPVSLSLSLSPPPPPKKKKKHYELVKNPLYRQFFDLL